MSTSREPAQREMIFDPLIVEIADYALHAEIESEEAYQIAHHVLMDSLVTTRG
jgi:2-methylcitrate dehydratase